MSEWSEAYMNVISRANHFAAAWDEFRGNEDYGPVKRYERMKLEIALAIYRVIRRKNSGYYDM